MVDDEDLSRYRERGFLHVPQVLTPVDEPAFPVRGAPVTLTAWVAHVDVPVEKGCMTFHSGSHRIVTFDTAADSESATPGDRPKDEALWAQITRGRTEVLATTNSIG